MAKKHYLLNLRMKRTPTMRRLFLLFFTFLFFSFSLSLFPLSRATSLLSSLRRWSCCRSNDDALDFLSSLSSSLSSFFLRVVMTTTTSTRGRLVAIFEVPVVPSEAIRRSKSTSSSSSTKQEQRRRQPAGLL